MTKDDTMEDQIKIVSTGRGATTELLNSDGKRIPGVCDIQISINSRDLITAVVTFDNVALDMLLKYESRFKQPDE